MNLGAGVHLTYCSNIHPGETWAEWITSGTAPPLCTTVTMPWVSTRAGAFVASPAISFWTPVACLPSSTVR